jgi:LmbE family N-acetylglucosaminyl deacetylase
VLAPHPDDEVFGMGGAIIKLLRQKSQVHLMWLTNGQNEERKAESQAVMSALGLAQPLATAFPLKSDSVSINDASDAIRAAIKHFAPDLICVPSVLDPHYDHVRVGTALGRAVQAANWRGSVLQYEVWGTLSPNVLLDVSDAMNEKEALMRLYVSQLDEPKRKYVERIIALNMYRGLTHQVDYAEAFVLLPVGEFRRLFEA